MTDFLRTRLARGTFATPWHMRGLDDGARLYGGYLPPAGKGGPGFLDAFNLTRQAASLWCLTRQPLDRWCLTLIGVSGT